MEIAFMAAIGIFAAVYLACHFLSCFADMHIKQAEQLAFSDSHYISVVKADLAAKICPFSWKTHYYRGLTYFARADPGGNFLATTAGNTQLADLNTAITSFKRAQNEPKAYVYVQYYIARSLHLKAMRLLRDGSKNSKLEIKELLDEARWRYARVSDFIPTHPLAYFWRGAFYYDDGQYEKAVSDFSRFLQTRRHFSAGYLWRANSYSKFFFIKNNPNEKINIMTHAIDDYSKVNNFYDYKLEEFITAQADSYFYRAGQLLLINNTSEALRDYATAVEWYNYANMMSPSNFSHQIKIDACERAQLLESELLNFAKLTPDSSFFLRKSQTYSNFEYVIDLSNKKAALPASAKNYPDPAQTKLIAGLKKFVFANDNMQAISDFTDVIDMDIHNSGGEKCLYREAFLMRASVYDNINEPDNAVIDRQRYIFCDTIGIFSGKI